MEATFAAVRSYELAADPIRGLFDLAHLQQIHQRLFGDVYDWAGKIRTVDFRRAQRASPVTNRSRAMRRRSRGHLLETGC